MSYSASTNLWKSRPHGVYGGNGGGVTDRDHIWAKSYKLPILLVHLLMNRMSLPRLNPIHPLKIGYFGPEWSWDVPESPVGPK